jgi:hypothetical protein
MSLRDELRDPWTYLLGAIAGGIGWAVGLPAAAFVGVAAVVSAAKAVTGVALGVGARTALPGERPPPPLPTRGDTAEGEWLGRAERATTTFDRLAASIPDQILSERSRSMGEQAHEALDGLRRLAGQASTTRRVSTEIDTESLDAELARLTQERDAERDPDVRIELTRSIGSVEDQLAVAQRLGRSLDQLLARIRSGALALEGLVAQLAEVLALADSGGGTQGTSDLERVADELEGLRTGLAETEQLSRRALSASGRAGSVGDDPAAPPARGPDPRKG